LVQKTKKQKTKILRFNLKTMKTSTIRLTIIAVLFFVSSFTFAGSAGKANNEFEITPIENLHLGKSIEKVWTINYSQLDKPVTIALRTVATGKEYIVRTNYFEVVYVEDNNGFGVRKMDPTVKEVPETITSSILNKQQLKTQKTLTTKEVSDDYALQLIATNLPNLLNDPYLHLIY
jgi:hypothetical protein